MLACKPEKQSAIVATREAYLQGLENVVCVLYDALQVQNGWSEDFGRPQNEASDTEEPTREHGKVN